MEGKISILYPNPNYEFLKDNFLSANRQLIWPSEEVSQYIDYVVELPKDKNEATEYLIIVFSLEPLPLMNQVYNEDLNLYELENYFVFSNIMAEVPFSSFIEKILSYVVRSSQ